MKTIDQNGAPEVRVVWPVEKLQTVAASCEGQKAVVIDAEDTLSFGKKVLDSGLAVRLANAGVELFSLIGTHSEQAHDALDWTLEQAGIESVLTSWHQPDDPEDIASFVIANARASGFGCILVVCDISKGAGASIVRHIAISKARQSNQ